jgi:hypothetical protein
MGSHTAPRSTVSLSDCTDIEVDIMPTQIHPEVVNVVINNIRFLVPMSNVIAIEYIEDGDKTSDLAKRILQQVAGVA